MSSPEKKCLLSIIIPFFNSKGKAQRILSTLESIKDDDVEVILVDDGSSDDTLKMLTETRDKLNVANKVLTQENKGPGGARNLGLKESTGQYIWFVDSDDDISLEAIGTIRNVRHEGYDFIDFDIMTREGVYNSLEVDPGEYLEKEEVRKILTRRWKRHVSKVFSKRFLVEEKLFFPEYCLYEDLPLVFKIPCRASCFYKSDVVGYHHHEEFLSITRDAVSPRYFDRLLTAEYGYSEEEPFFDLQEKRIFWEKFSSFYLVNTSKKLIASGQLRNWYAAALVMKLYREKVKSYSASNFTFHGLGGGWKYKLVFILIYGGSYLLRDSRRFFLGMRSSAWKEPIQFP